MTNKRINKTKLNSSLIRPDETLSFINLFGKSDFFVQLLWGWYEKADSIERESKNGAQGDEGVS